MCILLYYTVLQNTSYIKLYDIPYSRLCCYYTILYYGIYIKYITLLGIPYSMLYYRIYMILYCIMEYNMCYIVLYDIPYIILYCKL